MGRRDLNQLKVSHVDVLDRLLLIVGRGAHLTVVPRVAADKALQEAGQGHVGLKGVRGRRPRIDVGLKGAPEVLGAVPGVDLLKLRGDEAGRLGARHRRPVHLGADLRAPVQHTLDLRGRAATARQEAQEQQGEMAADGHGFTQVITGNNGKPFPL